jgi:poly-gamma-glutamate capsule biosynthesis protein CapA/YwtB (metallophosphatase superfamily)
LFCRAVLGWIAVLLLFACRSPGRAVTLVFVGDVMLGRDIATALDGDWAAAFPALSTGADVRSWLAEADLAFANLESPLTTAPFVGGRFDLRAPPEAVLALTHAGFDVVSVANNHALDGGAVGLKETLGTLERAGILALTEATVHYRSHDRIALVAYCDAGRPLDLTPIDQAAARADLVVVSVHWGAEYHDVTARQRALVRELVAAGADLIIGHGPHVLQPVERMGGAWVAYSLGNFLFDQPFDDTRRGAILRIMLDRGSIVAVQAIPTVMRHGRVQLATGDEATAILDRLQLPTD